MAKDGQTSANFDVDYVISFRYDVSNKPEAQQNLEQLLKRLASVGLATEVRKGNDHSILVFTRANSQEHLNGEIYRSRARDWIHGVRASEPTKVTSESLEKDPLSEAERLRIIYQMITNTQQEGGAGITPKKGEWADVENIFALHDHSYNKEWIKKWSTQWLLQSEDLDEIRNRLGEKIAYYFAFTQAYFIFLAAPTLFGLFTWLVLGHFSVWYAVVTSLWSVIFVEYWKHQEKDLAIRWGVDGVGRIENPRPEFQPKYITTDTVTGEKIGIFPPQDRLVRQLLQAPFAIAAVLVLGALIAACFAIEILISEVYYGPGKSILTFLPTILLTTGLPFLTGILGNFADKLSDYENYETDTKHERAVTSKHFILNFITSYLSISLTAFVYVPFGNIIVPYLDVFGFNAASMIEGDRFDATKAPATFTINPDRLRNQMKYFAITAQIVNFAMEVVVPYLKREGFVKIKEMKDKRSAGKSSDTSSAEDMPEEKEFLDRVRSQAELDVYDVYDDLREMVVQYGYLTLFSVIWPLVPLSYFINNWVELRSDAVKICIEMQRPTPMRADTIGPWLDALSFLSWYGSITMAALSYMFSGSGAHATGTPTDIKLWGLLLAVFCSEHLYLGARWIVAEAVSKLDSPGRQKARRSMYDSRQKYLSESLAAIKPVAPVDDKGAVINRTTLEDDARAGSLKASTTQDRFWARQRSWQESAQIGKHLIEKDVDAGKAARDKKEL